MGMRNDIWVNMTIKQISKHLKQWHERNEPTTKHFVKDSVAYNRQKEIWFWNKMFLDEICAELNNIK